MKIWEILKEENVGKIYKCNNENYEIYDAFGGLALRKESTICDQLDFDIYNFMTLDFEFIQQSVTFEEVLNSDKKCRIEHKLTAEYSNLEGFMYLDILLSFISHYFEDEECKKIFKEAKWYLEP